MTMRSSFKRVEGFSRYYRIMVWVGGELVPMLVNTTEPVLVKRT